MVEVAKVDGVSVGCDCSMRIGCAGEGVAMTSDGAVTVFCESARAGRASRTKDEICILWLCMCKGFENGRGLTVQWSLV